MSDAEQVFVVFHDTQFETLRQNIDVVSKHKRQTVLRRFRKNKHRGPQLSPHRLTAFLNAIEKAAEQCVPQMCEALCSRISVEWCFLGGLIPDIRLSRNPGEYVSVVFWKLGTRELLNVFTDPVNLNLVARPDHT